MSAEPGFVPARQLLRAAIDARRDRLLTTVAVVDGVEPVAARFARVRLRGEGLRTYADGRPADAFKVHLPREPHAPVPVPGYDADGRTVWPVGSGRPLMRAFTVTGADASEGTIAFDVLAHPGGATAHWLGSVRPGDEVSLTGMRTEFVDAGAARHHLLVGDASALPAIAAIVRAVPAGKRVTTVLDVDDADLPLLPAHPRLDLVRSGTGGLADALASVLVDAGTQAWIGAESTAVRGARRVVLDALGLHPDALHASGYWKRAVDGEAEFDASLRRFHAARAAGQDVDDPGVLQRLAFDDE